MPKDQTLVRVTDAESVKRRLTWLLAVVREAFGSYCSSMRPPVLTSFCGVTDTPLKSSFTPDAATVVAPSWMSAVTGALAGKPSDPGPGDASAT